MKEFPDDSKTPILLAPRKRLEWLTKGQELFNAEKYFEAHQVWEELWHYEKGQDKTFVQGLIVVAGHLVQIQKKNWSGAQSLAALAQEKLKTFPKQPDYLKLDLEPLYFALNYNLGILVKNPVLEEGKNPFIFPKLFEKQD